MLAPTPGTPAAPAPPAAEGIFAGMLAQRLQPAADPEQESRQVARLVSAMAGPLFSCTTGAQLPVDGGNERVV